MPFINMQTTTRALPMIDQSDTGGRAFLTVRQLCRRWGDVCHMVVIKRLKSDPDFPRPYRLGRNGRVQFFAVDEIEHYESLGRSETGEKRKEKKHDGKDEPRRRRHGARGGGKHTQEHR
jgi:hypothetical protein